MTPKESLARRLGPGKWFSVSQAVKYIGGGCSPQTIRNLCDDGNIKGVVRIGSSKARRIPEWGLRLFFFTGGIEEENENETLYYTYQRVSSFSQKESLETQIAEVTREVCKRENVTEDRIQCFSEMASSFGERKALNALIDSIIDSGQHTRKKLYCLIRDRFSRVKSTTSILYHLFNRYNVEVVFLLQDEVLPQEMGLAYKELQEFIVYLNAHSAGMRSSRICKIQFSDETKEKIIELRFRKKHSINYILRYLKEHGHKGKNGRGQEKIIGKEVLRKFIQERTAIIRATQQTIEEEENNWTQFAKEHIRILPLEESHKKKHWVSYKQVHSAYRESIGADTPVSRKTIGLWMKGHAKRTRRVGGYTQYFPIELI